MVLLQPYISPPLLLSHNTHTCECIIICTGEYRYRCTQPHCDVGGERRVLLAGTVRNNNNNNKHTKILNGRPEVFQPFAPLSQNLHFFKQSGGSFTSASRSESTSPSPDHSTCRSPSPVNVGTTRPNVTQKHTCSSPPTEAHSKKMQTSHHCQSGFDAAWLSDSK